MKRSLKGIENEIIHQIFIIELCFNICNSIEIIPGRGNDFLPYYYNLNFIKGIISLHSLLLSREKTELSIKNYIKNHKIEFPKTDTKQFEKDIDSISKDFKEIFCVTNSKGEKIEMPLRHKIGAHIDESFDHTSFTSGYIMPFLIPKYIEIIKKLKDVFFEFSGRSKDQNSFGLIKKQSDSILKFLLQIENEKNT